MRQLIKDYTKIIADALPISAPIYEFGSLQVPGQEGFADLRPFFPDIEYIGADMREGIGVDVVLNLHDIDLPDNSVGTVLLLDTLEHVEYPHKAIQEIYRIIRPGGLLIMSSVMNYIIHSYPNDYWRYTPEAFRSLLKPFDDSYVECVGDEKFPSTVVGIAKKGHLTQQEQAQVEAKIMSWKKYWSDERNIYHPKISLSYAAKLLLPPLATNLYRIWIKRDRIHPLVLHK